VHLNLGNVYDGLKQYPEAIKEFEMAGKLKPKSADAPFNLGSVYAKMRRFDLAVSEYRKATVLKPSDAYNWNGLGYACQSAGRYSEAMGAYEKALKLVGTAPDSTTFLYNFAVAALAEAGKSRSLPGNVSQAKADACIVKALAALEQAARAKPNDYSIRETYAEALVDAGRFADAIPEFEKAAQISPRQYDPYYNMAVAQEKLGKFGAAAEAYKSAAEFAPQDSHTAQYRQAEMLYRQQLYDEAAKVFTAVTRAEPSNLNAWLNLASCLRLKGDVEAETTVLEEASTKKGDPSRLSRLRCALAYRYYTRGSDAAAPDLESLNKATEQYNEALKLTPNLPEAYNGLGLISLRTNKLDEAIKRFRQAIAARPTFADAYNNLGVVYRTRGDLNAARQNYIRALQIDPGHKLAKDNLAALDRRR
jgi:tetratricopeptide (TPR) repeat protein